MRIPYGERTLADLLPSVVAALGVPGERNPLRLNPTRRACLLLVDGLGVEQLRAHEQHAPYLCSLLAGQRAEEPVLAAGFPTTTATSLGSLGVGVPPGEHGLLGFEVALPGQDRVLNALRWDQSVQPLAWQPRPTVFERAAAAGVRVTRVGPRAFDGAGLTAAALRGGRYAAAESMGERVAGALAALSERPSGGPALAYVYYGDLDATGHARGVDSLAWRLQLSYVDRLAESLASRLPAGAALWITADHGMVDAPPEHRLDLADDLELAAGVRLLAGEARARYVHAVPGAADDVLAAWRERLDRPSSPGLDGGFAVLSRAEAVAAGWFGPVVAAHLRERIGDVVVAARGRGSIVDTRREKPEVLGLVGLHGSLTDAELLVPLLEVRGS